jgi:hypothetical protein
MSKNKKQDDSEGFFWIVLGIVLIVLFWGLFGTARKNSKPVTLSRPFNSPTEKPSQLDKKKKLQELRERLILRKSASENHQKEIDRVILWSRITIGSLLISANVIFFLLLNVSETEINGAIKVNQLIGNQLNFNEVLLLFYSFFALVFYGTPSNFVGALKHRITKRLQTAHLDLSVEIKLIEKEIAEIKAQSLSF